MKTKSKMVRFLMSTIVIASMLCACTNDVIKSDVDEVSVQRKIRPIRPSHVNLEYGLLHNDLLDACLAECQNQIDPNEYRVYSEEDPNFYRLYAAYTNEIVETIFEMIGAEYGEMVLPIGMIEAPDDFREQSAYLHEQVEMNCPGLTHALNLTEGLFEEYLELISDDAVLEEDPNWIELTENIAGYAEEIYAESEALCQTEEEIETLDVMLSVMVGSFHYWSNPEKMTAWRDLEWDAKCKYLNLNELPEIELEEQHADNEKTTKEKVVSFVREDALGGLAAYNFGPYAAVAAGGFFSALEALSWD